MDLGQKDSTISKVIRYAALASVLLTPLPAKAQVVENRTAHIVEWDLPMVADASPGAMLVDTKGQDKDRLWFVTRLGTPRVFRMNPWKSPMKGSAQWTSWDLAEDSFTTGGLKRIKASHDRRYIFVRTAASLQRVDIQSCDSASCARTEWFDQLNSMNVSDVAVDDQYRVFTTGADNPENPGTSYVQMLTPGPYPGNNGTGNVTLTRWAVGGGAGFCAELPGRTTTSFPCVSGISVHPTNGNLVYYSEPAGGDDGMGTIAELNISTNFVRRWSLSALPADEAGPVQQPRQLNIDKSGIIWVVTGSGHLVSLDPCGNRMRKHTIPLGAMSDPFGIAPDDDIVGYTDAAQNKVGMLLPKGPYFSASPSNLPATKTTPSTSFLGERANITSGAVPPVGKVVAATVTTKTDGVFVEAFLDSNGNDDLSPLGITANKGKGQGTFFYAVGFNANPNGANRVGFVRFPKPFKVKHPRDDDDAEDGWDHNQHPAGWHMSDVGDDDDDGLGNEYDTPTALENVTVTDDAPLQSGQSIDYPMAASPTSLALIFVATSVDDPLAQLKVDIYNSLSQLMATSAPTPGVAAATVLLPAAGNYTARVRNMGALSNTHTPMSIVREPPQP